MLASITDGSSASLRNNEMKYLKRLNYCISVSKRYFRRTALKPVFLITFTGIM